MRIVPELDGEVFSERSSEGINSVYLAMGKTPRDTPSSNTSIYVYQKPLCDDAASAWARCGSYLGSSIL
jgi:hypothetical protein